MKIIRFNDISFNRLSSYIFNSFIPSTSVQRQAETYIDGDGCDYINSTYDVGYYTLTGDIVAKNKAELITLKRNLIKACDGKSKSILYYYDGFKEYFSEAVSDLPVFSPERGLSISFSITFNLYKFYWKANKVISNNIWQSIDNIKGTFQFPLILTERLSKADVNNLGDVDVPLKIFIYGGDNDITQTHAGFKIFNNSTGSFIKVDYDVLKNETVIIDTENFTITSNINGNIIKHLDPNSSFESFRLITSVNELEAINYNPLNPFTIKTEHYNTYLGV